MTLTLKIPFPYYCFTDPEISLIVITDNTAVIVFAVVMNFAFLSIIIYSSYDIRTYFLKGRYKEDLSLVGEIC